MILRLISPNVEYTYDYWQGDKPPAVVATDEHVWVRSSNSTSDNLMYFEQVGFHHIHKTELKPR